MSQKSELLHYLKAGFTITTYESYTKFGITQLATRISELKDDGEPILSKTIKVTNRKSREVTVEEYYLQKFEPGGQGRLL